MKAKIIKSDSEYEVALARVERLIDLDPDPGTAESDELELLALLVEDFETREYPVELPDPIEAVKFRMAQQGLRQRDLIPYVGSRSKVSEVLSGKRPLSLSMIRALHFGFGIPAKALIKEGESLDLELDDTDWSNFPLKEMVRRGWILAEDREIEAYPEKVVRRFFEPLGSLKGALALYRQAAHVRSARSMDDYALTAWTVRVLTMALHNKPRYELGASIDLETMQKLVRLSISDQGPRLARDFLRAQGITLVIEPHLSGTYLDGAAMLSHPGMPVIGMTLRYDRLDNFWFTLMHELAHIVLHGDRDVVQYYDDLDVGSGDDTLEKEADDLAREALIPREDWERSPASMLKSAEAAEHLARESQIHPAIVAGRMRYEFGSYKILSQLVGYYEVRRQFPEVEWNE